MGCLGMWKSFERYLLDACKELTSKEQSKLKKLFTEFDRKTIASAITEMELKSNGKVLS